MRRGIAGLSVLMVLLTVGCASAGVKPGSGGQVQFRMASDDPTPGFVPMTASHTREKVFVSPVLIATEADIQKVVNAPVSSGQRRPDGTLEAPTGYGVGIQLTRSGGKRISDAIDQKDAPNRLAIIVQGSLLVAPKVLGSFGRNFMIGGDFNAEDAAKVAAIMRPR